MRRLLLLPVAAATLLAACAVDDAADDARPDAAISTEPAAALDVCIPSTCGVTGTPAACGMQDDGCGGVMWCGPCACGSGFTACEVELPVLAEATVTLAPDQTIVVQTSNLSAGADSVLHLLLIQTGTQVAMNDDLAPGNPASRIVYTAPPLVGAQLRIVARAKSASTTGTATLGYLTSSTPVTLTYPAYDVTSTRAGDQLQTAPLPSLASGTHVVYQMDGASIARRSQGTYGATVALPSAGTTRYLIGSTSAAALPARLLRNDAAISGHDPDGDGLGSDLEAALGTCSSRSGTATDRFGVGFACSRAADARDTDGDGLQDGWEVRGRTDLSPPLLLSRWGADPRHKDLFVEVDFGRATATEAEEPVTFDEVATWARYWADRVGPLTSTQRAAHIASLINPDDRPGVRLHVDSGVAPTEARWAALYGDWGGHGVVPPDPAGGRLHYATARTQYMATSRRGVFRYALRAASGSGQGGGLAFVYGGAGRTAAHETGHTADLMHDGRSNPIVSINCKPNYASIMNYGFDDEPVGFSDGTGTPSLNNARLPERGVADPVTQASFLDVLDEVYGLTVDHAAGHVDWNRDGLYAPAGQTVGAYANYVSQRSCEYTRAGATELAGPHTSPHGPALARLGTRTFLFTGRDGALGWAYTTSSLACRVPDGAACTSFPTSGSFSGFDSERGVDAVRLDATGELLVVGLGTGNTLRWARVTGFSGSTPLLSTIKSATTLGVVDQPTLVVNEAGGVELYYRDGTGALWLRRYNRTSDLWTVARALVDAAGNPVRMATSGAPGAALARPLDASTTSLQMHLAFAASGTSCLQLWRRDWAAGHWVRVDRLPYCDANSDTLRKTMGRPALAWVPDGKDLALGGRLHLVHTPLYGDRDRSSLRQLTSVGSTRRMALEGLYDNDWAYAYGIDLLYEPGVDSNLRAAWTRSDAFLAEGKARRVRFDPAADGITDYTYGGEDDWRTMRSGICRPLAAEQSSPVVCPAAP